MGKAEGDFVTAQREMRARKAPNYDAACFHAQQCAEKYLKACLQEAALPFGLTHNLVVLLDLLLPTVPNWNALRPHLTALTQYAVGVRYPGTSAGRADGREALRLVRPVRKFARQSLGLQP
jgi:HEPN domain-containing protein